jgi:hypothetical protein
LSEAALASFLEASGFAGFITGLNAALTGLGLTGFQWPEDAATSAFSPFNGSGIVCMILDIGFSRRLADRFGKPGPDWPRIKLALRCSSGRSARRPDLLKTVCGGFGRFRVPRCSKAQAAVAVPPTERRP